MNLENTYNLIAPYNLIIWQSSILKHIGIIIIRIFQTALTKRVHKNHVDDCKMNESMQEVLQTSIIKQLLFFFLICTHFNETTPVNEGETQKHLFLRQSAQQSSLFVLHANSLQQ